MNIAELTTEVSHRGNDRQLLLKVVKEEERYGEDDEQNCDEILEECQVEGELLEYLLKEFEYEDVQIVMKKCIKLWLRQKCMLVSKFLMYWLAHKEG